MYIKPTGHRYLQVPVQIFIQILTCDLWKPVLTGTWIRQVKYLRVFPQIYLQVPVCDLDLWRSLAQHNATCSIMSRGCSFLLTISIFYYKHILGTGAVWALWWSTGWDYWRGASAAIRYRKQSHQVTSYVMVLFVFVSFTSPNGRVLLILTSPECNKNSAVEWEKKLLGSIWCEGFSYLSLESFF